MVVNMSDGLPQKCCCLRSVLFWELTQHWLVVCYRYFGTTCQYHLQGSKNPRRMRVTLKYAVLQGMEWAVIGSERMLLLCFILLILFFLSYFFLFLYCLFSLSIMCFPFLHLAATSCSGAVVPQSTPRRYFLPATSFMLHLLHWLASCSLRIRHWLHHSLYNCVPKLIVFISVH